MKNVILILVLIILDSFIENYYRIAYPNTKWEWQEYIWNICSAIRVLLWTTVAFLAVLRRFKFNDLWEGSMIVLMILMDAIEVWDWYANYNQRDDTMDWVVFILSISTLIFYKYICIRKEKAK